MVSLPLIWKRTLPNRGYRFYNLSLLREFSLASDAEIEEGHSGALLIFIDGAIIEVTADEALTVMNLLYGRAV